MAAIGAATELVVAADTQIKKVEFAAAAAIGDSVYLDSSSGKWSPADANLSEVAAGRDGIGILLTHVDAVNDYGVVATSGTIKITLAVDALLTKGDTLIVGATAAGDINPDADAASGWYKTVLGIVGDEGASSTDPDEFILDPHVSGQLIA